ncbi:unnamed protein product [Lota lota]
MTFEVDLVLCALLAVSSSQAEASQSSSIAPTLSSTPHDSSSTSTSISSPLPATPLNQTSMIKPRTQAGPRGTTQSPSSTTSPSASTTQAPAGSLHPDIPSELNVGDDAFKGPKPSSSLDPLLAGLVSVCVVTAAIISVVLFLRFRQQAGRPEFQRLQDVPMDDLMEDTLSSYTY